MTVEVKSVGQFNFLQVLIKDPELGNLRYIKRPDDDFSNEPQEVLDARDHPQTGHTPEIKAAYQSWKDEIEIELPSIEKRRVGTPREFLDLFSEAEQAAFFMAESANVELKIWWAKASTGNFSLDHPSVAVGLAGLVAAGILSQERSNEILASDFDQA